MSEQGSVTLVGGGKGGVGKSLLAMAVIDHRRAQGLPVVLVEAETTNSDVYLTYAPLLGADAVHSIDLAQGAGGWHAVGDVVEQHPTAHIVVNTPAGLATTYERFGRQVATLGALTGRFTTLWPINRLRDSLQLLARYMDAVPDARVAVVRNLFFGEPHRFRRFERSPFRAKHPDLMVGDLPELDDDLVDIVDERVPLEEVGARTTAMRRLTMEQWRRDTHAMLDALL